MKVFAFFFYKRSYWIHSLILLKSEKKLIVKLLKHGQCSPFDIQPRTSVECADGFATCSITGTINSDPFKTFVCDDVTVPDLCFCDRCVSEI